jgi:membrane-associated phospholipid phosphatase
MGLFKHYRFVDYATQGYLLFVALLIACFHNNTVHGRAWLLAAHGICLVGAHLLVGWHARRPQQPVLDFLRHFYPVLLYTGFFRETGELNRMFITGYIDPLVIGWDQALFGCQYSMIFMEAFPYVWVSEMFYVAYFSYYVMIGGVGLALFIRDRLQFFHFVSVISFVFYCCYSIYIFIPVIGPRLFMREIEGYMLPEAVWSLSPVHEFPAAVQSGPFFHIMALIYETFESPGAALPSSHVAIALATLYFSFRYLPRIRYLHLVMAALLCISTIYCRYHYVVDVFAGMLTTAVFLPLANRLYWRFERKARTG